MIFYVGTYTELGGQGACVAEAKDGQLALLSACAAIDNPNYLILSGDGQTLYAAASMGADRKGAVASYRVRGRELTPLSLQPTGGMDTCHVALSADERYLYAVNYSTGSVSAFPVAGGYIMPCMQKLCHGEGANIFPGRQEAAHTHQAVFRPGTRELFICDLGRDEIVVYLQDEDDGMLARAYAIPAAPGCGPRHLWFESENRFYLACELSSEIMRFEKTGDEWACLQTLSTLPEGCETENTVAAIRPLNGKIYVSNRGYDSVARFAMRESGEIAREAIVPVQGHFPRDILPIDDDNLLAANQFGKTVEWNRGGSAIATAPILGAVCLLRAPEA